MTATKKQKAAPAPVSIRKPQLRLLETLAKVGPMTRKALAEKAKVDPAGCTEYLGSDDAATRKANDKKHFPSLVSLGFVLGESKDGEPTTYKITPAGKTYLAKAQ